MGKMIPFRPQSLLDYNRWLLLVFLFSPKVACALDLGHTSIGNFATQTYALNNPSYVGNAYDLHATVLFTHTETGEQIRTGMYYDGGNTWRFRFNGSRPGDWTFASESDDPELRNATGTVTVQPDPTAKGFLTGYGSKFARQLGSPDSLQAQPYLVYMNLREGNLATNPGFGNQSDFIATWGGAANSNRRADYINQAKENGANAIFLTVKNQWFQNGALGWDDHNSTEPDRDVFAAIEDLIVDAHSGDVQVHMWAWGDEGINASERKWTPIGVPGGINGEADRRVQRYIADRLGPLPGWSMSYGFDLFEWVTRQQTSDWANYLTDRMGWDHNLAARGYPLFGPDGTESSAPANFLDSYASLRRAGQILETNSNDVSSADDGGPDSYAESLENVLHDPTRPIIYEERHTYERYFQSAAPSWPTTTMDGTRKLMWWWTMAGGAGGWIGFFGAGSSASGDGPYPAPEQLRTHATFWEDRLELDMEVDNSLTAGVDQQQYALHSPSSNHIVIFAEDTNAIQLDLNQVALAFRGTLVDAEAEYAEIDLGVIDASTTLLDLSSFGAPRDWALSLESFLPGDFNDDGVVDGIDFLAWQRGESPNLLSQSDLADWKTYYGMSELNPSSASHVVPEPATGLMAVAPVVYCLLRRRIHES